jgi:putative phosphoribosyl transferase
MMHLFYKTCYFKSMEEDFIKIPVGGVVLNGNLKIPKGAKGIVLFAHGSGSGRHSPRNQFVAKELQKQGLATLLIDLLTEDEERVDEETAHLRFDIPLLAMRLGGIADWLEKNPTTQSLKIGYFGASTGAAGALVAAASRPAGVFAVVSRGGRPDLAGKFLSKVKVPVLLIVGGEDYPVIEMNKEALELLKGEKKLVIVPNATHLFEEPGTLEEVAKLAAHWFHQHL